MTRGEFLLEYGAHRPFSIQLIRPLAYLAVQITVLTSVPFSLNRDGLAVQRPTLRALKLGRVVLPHSLPDLNL